MFTVCQGSGETRKEKPGNLQRMFRVLVYMKGCVDYYLCVLCVGSQASKITATTWAIPSTPTTACWTPMPTSAGRNHQLIHTETTGTRLRLLTHVEFMNLILSVLISTLPFFIIIFQCTVISKWRFWRRGVHIHRNGCQNSHGKMALLLSPLLSKHIASVKSLK